MSSAQNRHLEEVDAEQLIGALAGVVSAHVVTDATGGLVEIHVLATPELHPKQVVRNVESALSAGLGIQVDRRIVSVAQMRTAPANGTGHEDAGGAVRLPTRPADPALTDPERPDNEAPSRVAARAETRLEYVRYESRRDAETCTCQVVLRSPAGEVTGTGSGPDTAGGRVEAAARAVLDGMGRARPELRLSLEGAVISSSRGRSFVIVSAHAVMDRSTTRLAGAATLSRSPEEAAILAALQASNRWSA